MPNMLVVPPSLCVLVLALIEEEMSTFRAFFSSTASPKLVWQLPCVPWEALHSTWCSRLGLAWQVMPVYALSLTRQATDADMWGIEPYNALYDTPPPGTQLAELKRSECTCKISARGRDAIESTGKPLAGRSQAQPSQLDPAPSESLAATGSRSTSNWQTKKPVKQRSLRFDNESDDDPPQTRAQHTHDQGANDYSPPPKRPGRASAVAQGGGTGTHTITIDAKAAQGLGKLLGVNPKTATASTINETIISLSDHRAPQMGSSQRYSQVRSESSMPLPSLNKKGGGYHHDKLLVLAHPQPLKHPASGLDIGSPKHPRVDRQDDDMDMADPAPDPPPLPSFLGYNPPSVSSTQRAVVNALASQQAQVHALQTAELARFGAGSTPVPQLQAWGHFFLFARSNRSPSPEQCVVTPEPPVTPCILVPGSPSPFPTPERRPHAGAPGPLPCQDYSAAMGPKMALEPVLCPKLATTQTPRTSASNPQLPRNPDTATESDPNSDPVLVLRPQPKTHTNSHRPGPSANQPSQPNAKLPLLTSTPHHPTALAPQMSVRKPLPRRDPNTATESDSDSEPVPVLRPKPTAIQATRTGAPKPQPRQAPNSATESDMEPEPTLRPNPKKHANPPHAFPSADQPSQLGAKPLTRHHQHAPSRHKTSMAPLIGHHDTKLVLKQLGHILSGDSGDDDDSVILRRAIELSRQHRHQRSAARPSTSLGHQPGHSLSRSQPGPSTDRHSHHLEMPDDLSNTGLHPAPHTDRSPSADRDSDSDIDLTKSGLGRYPGTCGRAASHAIPRLLSTATRRGVYQDQDTYIKWVWNAYRRIVLRISSLRTDVKKRIREVIIYLFQFTNPGSSVWVMTANQRLFARLYPNTFHCRNLETDVGQFEHRAFKHAICVAFFWNQNSFAVQDHENFKVLPLPAVAFVLTMMQDCLREWETGVFRAWDNDFQAQHDMFDAHLMSLHEYQKSARVRLQRFQSKWFRKGMKHARVQIHKPRKDQQFCQPITWAHTVWPDTPENSKPEFDEDGCLTAQAKGKGKVQPQSSDSDSRDDSDVDV